MPRRAYPIDLTDAQWAILEPYMPDPKPGGRPAKHPRREIVNALLYVLRSGGARRLLPQKFPPSQTVYDRTPIYGANGGSRRNLRMRPFSMSLT